MHATTRQRDFPDSRKSSLKVLWVTPNIRSAAGGPTSTVINGLIAENSAGLHVELASTCTSDQVDEEHSIARLNDAGIGHSLFRRIGFFNSSSAWGLSLSLTSWLASEIKSFDVIHLQYVWCWPTLVVCFLRRFNRVSVVLTPHESLTSYDIEVASRSRFKRLLKRVLRRFILSSVDRLLLMSDLEENDTATEGVPVSQVPHAVITGLGTGLYREGIAENGRTHPVILNQMIIGFIGRNIPKKGLDRLIRAVGLSGNDGLELRIAGPMPEPELEAQYRDLVSELGLDGRVRWHGFVDDRVDFLADLDVLVMPSEYEGFGMVAAEAMACGTPVVVPEQSGVADLVASSGGGIMVEEPSPENLCSALETLSRDPGKRSEMGEKARHAVLTRHSAETFAASSRMAYERSLGHGDFSN